MRYAIDARNEIAEPLRKLYTEDGGLSYRQVGGRDVPLRTELWPLSIAQDGMSSTGVLRSLPASSQRVRVFLTMFLVISTKIIGNLLSSRWTYCSCLRLRSLDAAGRRHAEREYTVALTI